ncbi:hypothetical protein P20311_3665 [Pseudoalteromonas sp. BSi20311]|nr:hypothetical protein P20311_3665 [Pseudoalteromonas sp. BSi20311]
MQAQFLYYRREFTRALSQHVKLPARRKAPPTFNPNTVLGLIFC